VTAFCEPVHCSCDVKRRSHGAGVRMFEAIEQLDCTEALKGHMEMYYSEIKFSFLEKIVFSIIIYYK